MTTTVTVDQLRNLTDRAATGLSADEQARLRDGIGQLYAELEHARAEADRYAEAESADAAAGSYAGRVEELEAALALAKKRLARVQRLLDSGPIGTCCDHLLRAALDARPVATQATEAGGWLRAGTRDLSILEHHTEETL